MYDLVLRLTYYVRLKSPNIKFFLGNVFLNEYRIITTDTKHEGWSANC